MRHSSRQQSETETCAYTQHHHVTDRIKGFLVSRFSRCSTFFYSANVYHLKKKSSMKLFKITKEKHFQKQYQGKNYFVAMLVDKSD
jgi:hypothetical protein